MPETNDHILEKLRQTIDNWSGEVSSAQDSLSRQIMETRAELTRLVTLIQRQSGDAAATDPDTIVKLALLQEELDELKQKRKQERRDSQQLRLNYAVIQNKLQMATVTLESVLSENAALKSSTDVASLKDSVEHVADVHEQSQSSHAALDEKHAHSDSLVDDLQRELDELRTEYESLTTSHEQTVAELDASKSEINAVERRSHQLTEDQEALQLQVKRLQDRIVEKEKEIASLQASLETATSGDSGLQEENDALRGELATLRESFQQQAVTLEQHIRSIQTFQEREVEFAERESALRSEIAALKLRLEQSANAGAPDLDERERTVAEKEQHLLESAQWVKNIESAALIVQQNLDTLHENMLNPTAEESAAANAEAEALRAELEEQRSENAELRSTVVRLQNEIEARIAGTAAVAKAKTDEIANLRAQLEASNSSETELASLRREIEARIAGTAAVAQATQKRLHALESELKEQQDINASQTQKIATLHAELSEKEEAVAANGDASQHLDARTQELQAAQAHIAELEEKLGAQNRELEQLRVRANGDSDSGSEPASPFDAFDENGQQRAIGEILLDAEIITETQLFNALVEQDKSPQRRIGSILLEQGLIQEDTVAKILASQLRLEYVDLDETEYATDALAMLDGRSATHHMSIPVRVEDDVLVIAMANPLDQIALEALERTTGKRIQPIVAPLSDITSAIVRNYGTDFRNDPHPASREESLQIADE